MRLCLCEFVVAETKPETPDSLQICTPCDSRILQGEMNTCCSFGKKKQFIEDLLIRWLNTPDSVCIHFQRDNIRRVDTPAVQTTLCQQGPTHKGKYTTYPFPKSFCVQTNKQELTKVETLHECGQKSTKRIIIQYPSEFCGLQQTSF